MTKPNPIPWHKFLAFVFKQLLARFNVTVQAEVNLMSDPPRADILLIRRLDPIWTAEQLARLPDGIVYANKECLYLTCSVYKCYANSR